MRTLRMLASLMCIVTPLLAAMPRASAQPVIFVGAGLVSKATDNCLDGGIFEGLFVLASYMPANQGDNGPDTNLTFSSLPQAIIAFGTNLAMTGPPPGDFVTAQGTTVSLTAKRYRSEVDITEKPAIGANTQRVTLVVKIKRTNGLADCVVTLNLNLERAL